jgi:hypothetical protein
VPIADIQNLLGKKARPPGRYRHSLSCALNEATHSQKTASHYGGDWSDDDYVVLDNDQVIGRIMLHPQAPEGQPWFWSITARTPQTTADRGYAPSREQAMADFKARWKENAS